MVLPGELCGTNGTICTDCKTQLPLAVWKSAAGYYYGYFCPNCGPYSRESGYFATELEAEKAIKEGEVSRRRRSEPGIFISPEKVSLPDDLGEEKKNLRELLEKRIEEPYPEEYKKEVEEYFRKLIE